MFSPITYHFWGNLHSILYFPTYCIQIFLQVEWIQVSEHLVHSIKLKYQESWRRHFHCYIAHSRSWTRVWSNILTYCCEVEHELAIKKALPHPRTVGISKPLKQQREKMLTRIFTVCASMGDLHNKLISGNTSASKKLPSDMSLKIRNLMLSTTPLVGCDIMPLPQK